MKHSEGACVLLKGYVSDNIYIYIPRTQLTSIFEDQPPKGRPFTIKTRVIWVPDIYIHDYSSAYRSIYRYRIIGFFEILHHLACKTLVRRIFCAVERPDKHHKVTRGAAMVVRENWK